MGTGWCGVFKGCQVFVDRKCGLLETDLTLPGFDLFVIHLDADVAEKKYTDCSEDTALRRSLRSPLANLTSPPLQRCLFAAKERSAHPLSPVTWLNRLNSSQRSLLLN